MTELRTCVHCGTAEGELTEFNGRLYCPGWCRQDLCAKLFAGSG